MSSKRVNRRAVGAVLLCAGMIVASCGGDDDTSGGDDGAAAAVGTGDDGASSGDTGAADDGSEGSATDGGASEEGTPKPGGELVLGMDRENLGYDPTVNSINPAGQALYDSLMKMNADGEPEPYLAESMETTDDGTTWVMKLREGVNFHDGEPLNAEAVIFNVERHRAPDSTSLGRVYAEWIDEMTAVDDLTVEFVLDEPRGVFPVTFALAMGTGSIGFIGSPKAIEERGDDFSRNPVGAGPYKFVEWVPDSHTILEKNEDYWQEGKPYIDRLEFRPLPDTETRLASIQNGDIDFDYVAYHTELIRADADPNIETYYDDTMNGAEYLYFNYDRPPFDDRRMREAVVSAIDVEAMAAALYEGDDTIHVDGYFSESNDWYSEEAGDLWPEYDPDRARELVAEYEADGGDPSFTYKTTNSPNRVLFSEFLQTQFAAVGLDVEIETFDLSQYASTLIQSRDFQLAGWVGGQFVHPFPLVTNLMHSDGPTNYGSYSNPEMDDVLDRAMASTDLDEQRELYQEAQEIANEDIVVAWYSMAYLSAAAKPEVQGIDPVLHRGAMDFFSTIWIDE